MVKETRGDCKFCGKEYARRSIRKHVDSCAKGPTDEGKSMFLRIFVEGRYDGRYWMYLEVSQTATLQDLDSFLRRTWLECCGHLSEFTIQGRGYSETEGASLGVPIQKVVQVGEVFLHEYDFGSTTTLKLTAVSLRQGATKRERIEKLSQNNPLDYPSCDCGVQADYVRYDEEEEKLVVICRSCLDGVEEDENEDEWVSITNSPRMGVCGYC